MSFYLYNRVNLNDSPRTKESDNGSTSTSINTQVYLIFFLNKTLPKMDLFDIFYDEVEPSCYHTKSEINLLNKIKNGDVKGVQKFLSYKRTRKTFDINCITNDGYTSLSVVIISKLRCILRP